jgi:hypothetical protein
MSFGFPQPGITLSVREKNHFNHFNTLSYCVIKISEGSICINSPVTEPEVSTLLILTL